MKTMRLKKIAPRWSAPLVSAGLMLLVGTIGITSGCGSGSAEKKIDPTPTASPTPTPSGSPQTDGVVRVFVNWPSRTGRIIPIASQRVDVVLLDTERKELTRVVANRPAQTDNSAGDDANTSTVIFSPVPAGSYYIIAAAYPEGGNVAQAKTAGAIPVTVTSGATNEITLSLTSDIANLAINTQGTGITLAVGQSATVTTTATNAAGATVLTSPLQLGFSSSAPAIATISASGVVQAVSAGTATITVADAESGKSAQTTVTVTAPSGGQM